LVFNKNKYTNYVKIITNRISSQ